MVLKTIEGGGDLADALWVRKQVFTLEQGFSDPDWDEHDPDCLHVVAYEDGAPVATGRVYEERGVFHPGRIAVLKSQRGKQLGRLILDELERMASERGARRFSLSAQLYAVPFYEKCGYRATGERHMDEFCEHETMTKEL